MEIRYLLGILTVAAVAAGASIVARVARGQASQDAQVMEQLKSAGSNLSKPHPIEFYLYVPTQEAANRVATKARALGYEIKKLDRAAMGPGWLVLAGKTLVPTESALSKSRSELEALAKDEGGEYDGWEAPVVK
jgi:hypothetical protein